MSDWIKIHRSILDSYCFANPVSFKIWAWMLLKANYKQGFVPLKVGKGFITVKIERGQFIFGRHAAEKELNIDGSAIYRMIQKFEELEQIIIEPNSQYSIITICNYDTYQNKQDIDEQLTNSQRTSNEQVTNNTRTTLEHKEEELEEKEGKEEKECFNTMPLAENFNGLPDIKIGSVIELFRITKQTDVTNEDVSGLWEVFKIQNLHGKKYYPNADEVYSHFINWSKKQNIETNGKSKTSTVGKDFKFDKP